MRVARISSQEVHQTVEQGRSYTHSILDCINVNRSRGNTNLLITNYRKLVYKEERDNFIDNLDSDNLYILALSGYLKKNCLKNVYKKYSSKYFNKTKCRFTLYYSYCMIFQSFISISEQKLLIKKLSMPQHAYMIKIAILDFKFLHLYLEELDSAYIIYKLSTVN